MSTSGFSSRLNVTKLFQPPVPDDFVPRPRLQQRLNRIVHCPLTLVSAPAGYGKTTAVSAWIRSSGYASGWLSLDAGDNDLSLFLTCFLAATYHAVPDAGTRIEEILHSENSLSVPVFFETLYAALYEVTRDVVLALDDCQDVVNSEVWKVIGDLMRHPHPHLHLVLISRHDPPSPLSDWRARNLLLDVRSGDLRFTLEETTEFLHKATEAEIDAQTIARLQTNAEGWVAGLRLAVLSLPHVRDIGEVIPNPNTSNIHILTYLADQVLAKLPPHVQAFMLRTSILDRMTGPLCDAVVALPGEDSNGQALLSDLYRENVFIIPLDDENSWFRYHHLLRDFLRSRLARQYTPQEVAALHRRASNWYHEKGFVEDAIRHAISAGDMDEAVRLVAAHRHELLNEERWQRLTSWLGLFPDQVVHESPDLLLIKALFAHAARFNIAELKQLTDEIDALIHRLDLDPGLAQRLLAENDVLRAIPHFYALDAATTLAYCRRGLENLPRSYYTVRSYAYTYAAGALVTMGDIAGANNILQDGQNEDLSYKETPRVRNALSRGFVHWMDGDLDGVRRAAKFIEAAMTRGNLRNSVGWANYFMACVHYHRNDLAGAEYHAGQLFEQRYMNPAIANVHGAFLLALVHQARNDRDAADEIVDRATTFVVDLRSQSLLFLVQAFQVELDIMRGEIDMVARWLAQLSPIPPSPMPLFYTPQLTVPKALLAVNDPAHAAKLEDCLRRLRELVESTYNRRFLIEVLALESLYYDSLGDAASAVEALRRSLSLARPGGFIRLFVDLGPRMKSALNRLPDNGEMADYVARILAAYSPGRSVSPSPHPVQRATIEPLTLRENEILELLAKRLSNKEIAQMLVISPVTVKRHTINIYQKLYVQNRRDAVLAAQELGLLD